MAHYNLVATPSVPPERRVVTLHFSGKGDLRHLLSEDWQRDCFHIQLEARQWARRRQGGPNEPFRSIDTSPRAGPHACPVCTFMREIREKLEAARLAPWVAGFSLLPP